LIQEYQEHAGPANGSSANVQYAYAEMSAGNNSRPTSMTYTNGRKIYFTYTAGVDASISRLTKVLDNDGVSVLQSYQYLGLDTMVYRTSTVTALYYYSTTGGTGDGGDKYVGLDRFGRVVDQKWTNTVTTFDEFQYGYDPDGNALYRKNLANGSFSELYHANGTPTGTTSSPRRHDAHDAHDGFLRVCDAQQDDEPARLPRKESARARLARPRRPRR